MLIQSFSRAKRLATYLFIFFNLQINLQNASSQSPLLQNPIALAADSLFKMGQKQAALDFLTVEKSKSADAPAVQRAAIEFALGDFYLKEKKIQQANQHAQAARQLLEPLDQLPLADQASIFYQLANCAYNSDQQAQAKKLLEKTIELQTAAHGDHSQQTVESRLLLAILLNDMGDFDGAQDLDQKAIRTLKILGKTTDLNFGRAHHNYALHLYNAGDCAQAIENFKIALPIFREKHGIHPRTAICLSCIGSAYADLGDGDHALEYQLQATEMFRQAEGDHHPHLRIFYTYTATAFGVKKQYADALEYLHRALHFKLKTGENARLSPELSMALARCHTHLNNPELALHYADTALVLLNFDPADANLAGRADRDYFWFALLGKAHAQTALFKKNRDPVLLQSAAETMSAAQTIIFSLIEAYDSQRNKLAFYRHAVAGFEKTISIQLDLWQSSGDPKWLQAAFENSEMSKSLLLFQKVVENQTQKQQAKLPAELLEHDAELLGKLTAAERQHFESAKNQTLRDSLQDQIFNLKNEQALLRSRLRQTCPDCFAATTQFPKTDLSEIQNSLADGQALLEFFTTDTAVFAFLVSRDSLVFRKIQLDFSMEKTVAQLRNGITRYFTSENKTSEIYLAAAQEYSAAASVLYEKLLAPFADLLPTRLTIVPDGVLAYVPFEALLTAQPERLDRFQQHEYFGKKHTIGYSYSAALLREMSTPNPTSADIQTEKLIAFAPFFDGSDTWQDSLLAMQRDPKRAGLQPLPHSGEEVFRIAKITEGKALVGAEASKKAFLREAPHCKILHLATHGKANDRAGDYSFLAFNSSDNKNERLYVSEIYNLKLTAELVTLSACETGLGQLHLGEGIISLARAFASAGARSIVQSQWVVSDSQTRHLMVFFYKNLKRGLTKDLALAEAKREYLSKFRGEEAHPYFWAGFLLIGDTAP